MENKEGKSKFPNPEEFDLLSVDEKVTIFTGLPIPAQKLLVGCSAFASTVNPDMARVVSKLHADEFEEAKNLLAQTPYFNIENGRLSILPQMKNFINGDLKKFWEDQKRREGGQTQ